MCSHCCSECTEVQTHIRCWYLHQINLGTKRLWTARKISWSQFLDLRRVLNQQLEIDVEDLGRVQVALAVRNQKRGTK